jgi:predicted RNA binding protein YcfA (HicA-like mRNA interferase family)
MTAAVKILGKMRNNPTGWRIEDLKTVAARSNIQYRQPGTSHVTFRHPTGAKLTVPARKPIKPVYVKKFLELIDEVTHEKD